MIPPNAVVTRELARLRETNARLVEACTTARVWLRDHRHQTVTTVNSDPLAEKLDAALAAAKGEP